MSIEQSNVIDFIGTNNATGDVTLAITDHLDWGDEYGHLRLIQAKINKYMQFLESGEINEAYPQSLGKKCVIEVVGKFALSKAAEEFFQQATAIVSDAGFSLRFRKLESHR